MTDPEHLIRLRLEDGTAIDFSRAENNDVLISHNGHVVNLGKASAQVTMDLLALLEPFGEIEEEDEDETT